MPIVELDRISKSYGDRAVVENLSLRIEAGSMLGLLGPNGAGKTTTIRMMVGITLPDTGAISLFGGPFTPSLSRRVGYLPEERGLYQNMKVLDQLVLFGRLYGLDSETAEMRARQWCKRLDFTQHLSKVTRELSKGMQQKVQFAAALLHQPRLVIMDEPFSGLDPVNAAVFRDVLLDLKSEGCAILFSSHRMDQVERLCDEICLINSGHVVLSGSVREVKSRYRRNRLLIDYEGDGSFLESALVEDVREHAGQAEVYLKPGADAQALLRAATERATVNRFELIEPSLEDIFIETVGAEVYA